MNLNIPLACDMNVFTPAEREAHVQNTIQLVENMQGSRKIENGFEIAFPNETQIIIRIGEFIALERLCCPFLTFDLGVLSRDEPVRLSIAGPEGTQEFLRMEFEGAFS
jgi:hypothetical protein